MPQPSLIAIDGPVASGKTTVGQCLASKLSYSFLDTGDRYRAVTKLVIDSRISNSDELAIADLCNELKLVLSDKQTTRIIALDQDISEQLHTQIIDTNVSFIARLPKIRNALLDKQRDMARSGKLIMAGRDIGTVILPYADLKLYIEASAKERAKRRWIQYGKQDGSYEKLLTEIERRDHLDSTRPIAPLKPAGDSIIIKTDDMSLQDTVEYICNMYCSQG